jgi:hypothetical protein
MKETKVLPDCDTVPICTVWFLFVDAMGTVSGAQEAQLEPYLPLTGVLAL